MSTSDRMKRLRQRKAATGERSYLVWLDPEGQRLVDRLKAPDETLAALFSRALQALARVTQLPKPATKLRRESVTKLRPSVTELPSEVLNQVKAWRAAGLSWSQCAQRLDAQGIEPPKGGRWYLGDGRTNLNRFMKG